MGALKKGFGCLTIIVAAFILYAVTRTPAKCGEVGYYAKLTSGCRAAQGMVDSDAYCSPDELADMRCAAATYRRNSDERKAEIDRELRTKTY